jgi:outer membrane protein TolC
LERASSTQSALKEEIKLDVAKSFYSLLGLQEKQRLYLEAIKAMDRISAGFAVLTAKASLRRDVAGLEKEIREVRYDYLEAMGSELFAEVRVVGTLDVNQSYDIDLQRALAWAKQNRTELRAIQFQQEVDRLAVSLSLAERYPVFLFGGAYEARNNELPLSEQNWNAVLSMNIPIFDGFANLARVRESRFRADQGRLQRVQLEDRIERDVRSAYEDFVFWTEELERRQKEADQIRKNRGASRDIEYVRWNLDAEMGIVDAKLQRRLASATLDKSIGLAPGGLPQ